LFAIAIVMLVGDGTNTKFWIDRWLHGQSISDLAPNLIKLTNGQGTLSKDGSWVLSSIGIRDLLKQISLQGILCELNEYAPCTRVSKLLALLCCKFFLWLAILNRCWTCQIRSDTSCSLPLCDKAEETNQHIWSHLWFLDKFGILVYHLESSWFAAYG